MIQYQPKTGEKCGCKRGVQRDNCPACEGTGWRIDFAAIRRRSFPITLIGDADHAQAQQSTVNKLLKRGQP